MLYWTLKREAVEEFGVSSSSDHKEIYIDPQFGDAKQAMAIIDLLDSKVTFRHGPRLDHMHFLRIFSLQLQRPR